MLNDSDIRRYLAMARESALRAHNPYSRFSVGCTLLDVQGKTFQGCNIESSSYAATLCAERVAAAQAIAHGVRSWQAIFVVSPTRVSPCGVCRQFLYEFCPDLAVYMGYLKTDEYLGPIALSELLPLAAQLQQTSLGAKE